MKLALVLSYPIVLAACAGIRTPVGQPSLRSEIEAANRALEVAFRTGDLLGVARSYQDDAILLSPSGKRVSGRVEIDEYWTRFQDPLDWQLEVFAVEGEGDIAYQRGRSHLVSKRDGERHTSVVDFVLVWRRQPDGGWKIAVDAYW